MNLRKLTVSTIGLLSGLVIASSALAAEDFGRNPSEHNTVAGSNVAADGYDVVAYFNNQAVKGLDEFTHSIDGVLTYKFSSQENLDAFKADSNLYEPAYGGWCAYAMGKVSRKVEVDPTSFVIQGDRLLLFAPGTKKRWLKGNEAKQIGREEDADLNWEDVSGEAARNVNY